MQPSQHLKQSFRIVGLLATVLVVLIHYRSADTLGSGLQGWAQEAIVNGVARVAVPLFAFTAGFFYFLSATGTWQNYFSKLRQRGRTVALPYLLVSLLALTAWAALRMFSGIPITLSGREIATRLFLHPMPEQLWFLRDLLVLVAAAPLIGALVRRASVPALVVLAVLWMGEIQLLPLLAGWYVLNIETLFFFSLGAVCVRHLKPLERLAALGPAPTLLLGMGWAVLLLVRVLIDPEFDLWYVHDYTATSLVLQKLSILLGCAALLAISGMLAADSQRPGRWQGPGRWQAVGRWQGWAGCSFMVYLIHEFPLREALERLADQVVAAEVRFWVAAPLAIVISFAAARLADVAAPSLTAILTGGRTPGQMAGQTLSANRSVSR